MKKLIIVIAIVFSSTVVWGGPMQRPMTEQQQYAYLATKTIAGINFSFNLLNLYLELEEAGYPIGTEAEAIEFINDIEEIINKAEYYDSMITITVPKYSSAYKQTYSLDTKREMLDKLRLRLESLR